jgi:hypothetical protein
LFFETAQSLNGVFDRVDGFLKDDLLRGVLELLARQPAPMRQRPMAAPTVDPAGRSRKDSSCWRLRRRSSAAASRALTRSRTASGSASGAQTPVSSPARCSRASVTASRRFVLIRSPERFGIKAGATTRQSWPRARTWR